MVAHIFKTGACEAEAGEVLGNGGQPGLQCITKSQNKTTQRYCFCQRQEDSRELEASLDYSVSQNFKTKQQKDTVFHESHLVNGIAPTPELWN